MSIQAYKEFAFKQPTLDLIHVMNVIVDDMIAQGYVMTVRQLYYQLVATDQIVNSLQSYKRLAGIVNDARLAGLMRWDGFEDRMREFVKKSAWNSPQDIMQGAIRGYHMDLWEDQSRRVFVIVEKDALIGVLEKTCNYYDVPIMAARGYASASVLREFARDMVMPALDRGQDVTVLHLGDHDPSGIDMSRDLEERINMFAECDDLGTCVDFERIALTIEQIREQRPPPNAAKSEDARFKGYVKMYGKVSWELDALSPRFLNELLSNNIESLYDEDKMDARRAKVEYGRDEIKRVAELIDFDIDDNDEDDDE